jgi:hypothetical protein
MLPAVSHLQAERRLMHASLRLQRISWRFIQVPPSLCWAAVRKGPWTRARSQTSANPTPQPPRLATRRGCRGLGGTSVGYGREWFSPPPHPALLSAEQLRRSFEPTSRGGARKQATASSAASSRTGEATKGSTEPR